MVLTHDFSDTQLRVRLHPQTSLQFEGTDMVTLLNPNTSGQMRMKYDILLLLYPMVHWVTVGELCQDWPAEDQIKIQGYLKQFHHNGILMTEADEAAPATESASLPEQFGNNVTINIENHHHMLRDSIRMACYRRAIEQAVTPDSIVMDLGAGSGILSVFAARAGAKHVYAIEKRPDIVMLAREIIRANGLEDKITVIQNSSHMVQPEDLPELPTLMVSEILGNAILEENVLEFTLDARQRLLAPGAVLLPQGLEIYVVPFDAGPLPDRSQEVTELETIYGLNLTILKNVLTQKSSLKLERFNPAAYTLMGEPVSAIHLDFQTMEAPTFKNKFEIIVGQDGFINGFCAYFKAHLNAENLLTNSPWAPPTHWTQTVFQFPERRAVKAGERYTLVLNYDGGLDLWFDADYPEA